MPLEVLYVDKAMVTLSTMIVVQYIGKYLTNKILDSQIELLSSGSEDDINRTNGMYIVAFIIHLPIIVLLPHIIPYYYTNIFATTLFAWLAYILVAKIKEKLGKYDSLVSEICNLMILIVILFYYTTLTIYYSTIS